MKKFGALYSIFLAAAFTNVGIALPQAAFAEQATDEAAKEKYEYMLAPFHHGNFQNKKDFEKWLNNTLGADDWESIFHFAPFNQRLFMRRVGGPKLDVSYQIAEQKISPLTHNFAKWVPAYDKIGGKGKFVVWLYKEKKKTFAVYEIRRLDGVLQTLSWEAEPVGVNQPRDPKKFKSAVTKLAEQAHVSNTIGLTKNQSHYSSIGLGETTPGRVNTVDVRFGKASVSTKPKKLKKMINKQAKKGYIISDFQLSDNTGSNFIVVFARVKVNGKFEKRKCVVEPITVTNLVRMVNRMNLLGKKGYEKVFQTFAGSFNSFQFVLCKDK